MDDKNYYMNEEIDDSGIAETRNPHFIRENYTPFNYTPRSTNVGQYFDNDSQYDPYLGNITGAMEREDIVVDDLRAEAQAGWDRWGNALLNNVVIAGTSAIQSLGTIVEGIPRAIIEGDASKLYDNAIGNAMTSIQESAASAFPIYRGNRYNNASLWEKMGSGIFWADIVQNLGYTEAMIIPGLGMSKLLASAPKFLRGFVPSLVGTLGEASTEAIHSKKDKVNLENMQLRDGFNILAQGKSDEEIRELEKQYYAQREAIEEDAKKAGNLTFGTNVALLTASGYFQVGKLLERGFGTARFMNGLVKATKDGTFRRVSAKRAIGTALGKKVLDSGMEGTEEVLQGVIPEAAYNYAGYNSFNESIFNQDKREMATSLIKSFGDSWAKAMNDPNTAVEFMSGLVIGAIGVPMFSKRTGITIANSLPGELAGTYQAWRRAEKIVDNANKRLQDSDKTKALYNGVVRHMALEDEKRRGLEDDDSFKFHTEDSKQIISDIMMFDEIGAIKRMKEMINSSIDTSDESIQELINSTSKDGNGPFMRNGNPMSIEEVRGILQEKKDALNKRIDSYVKTKESLQNQYPHLSKEALQDAVYLKEQLKDFSDRRDELSKSIFERMYELTAFSGQGLFRLSKKEFLKDLLTSSKVRNAAANNEARGRGLDIDFTKNGFIEELVSNEEYREKLFDAIEKSYLDEDSKSQLLKDLADLPKLAAATDVLQKQLKTVLTKPSKSKKDRESLEDRAKKKFSEKKVKKIMDKLSTAKDLSEFRTMVDEIEEDELRNEVLKKLEEEGSEVAKNYKETNHYDNEVKKALNELGLDSETVNDALKLLKKQKDSSGTLADMENFESLAIQDETTFDEDSGGDIEVSLNRHQKAQKALYDAMAKVKEKRNYREQFSEEAVTPEEKTEGTTKSRDDDSTGSSQVSTVPPVSPTLVTPTAEVENGPVGDITIEDVKNENQKSNDKVEGEQRTLEHSKGKKKYYRPAVPEVHIEASRRRDFRPFDEVMMEMAGLDFSEIYDYLRQKGAFDYLNAGRLKERTEVGFMIDPEFEERVKDKEWHTAPTIFIIDKEAGQVLGSLDEGNSILNFEGLAELEERVRKEYTGADKSKPFVSKETTTVSKIMIGKIPYSNEERSLADIPNVNREGESPKFMILGNNGEIIAGDNVEKDKILPVEDANHKAGRLYLLIPNGAGMYSPVAVRVKHFNKKEFNIKDATVGSTPIGERLRGAISALSESRDAESLQEALRQLNEVLYIGDIGFTLFSGAKGYGLSISRPVKDANGKPVMEKDKDGNLKPKLSWSNVYFTDKVQPVVRNGLEIVPNAMTEEELAGQMSLKDADKIFDELLNTLMGFNLPLQVHRRKVGDSSYMQERIDSGVLTSNLSSATSVSTWFTLDYLDAQGRKQPASNPVAPAPAAQKKVETPVGGKESAITGTKVISTFTGKTYYVDLSANTITDENGNNVPVTDKNRILFDIAWANNNFGNLTEALYMIDNKVITPSGRVLDRTKQRYLSTSEAEEVKKAINERNKGIKEDRKTARETVDKINANQAKVDRSMTDREDYYVLEDDGVYHAYSRVHTAIGHNSKVTLSKSKQKALDIIGAKLTKLSQKLGNPNDRVTLDEYNEYLKKLEKAHGVNLSDYYDWLNSRAVDSIVNIIRDKFTGLNSQRALDAGSAVDIVVRQYFTTSDVASIRKPSNMTEEAFRELLSTLSKIKSNIELKGERFLANNIVLFHKYPDGRRIAGELDILSVNSKGEFRIYDIKTGKYSFHDTVDKKGIPVNYFRNKANFQVMSNYDYYTLQLSAYKNLFESQYGTPISGLAIMPFVLGYDGKSVSSITAEKGIPIQYNPAVNVPLDVPVNPSSTAPSPMSSTPSVTDNADSNSSNLNSGRNTTNSLNEVTRKEMAIRAADNRRRRRPKLREVEKDSKRKKWNKEKEMAWLNRVLPKLTQEQRVQFVEGLIKIGFSGAEAWGMFDKGIITLSDVAAEGTLYHEAFHLVFNMLLDSNERSALLNEYREKHPELDDLALEEMLAEDFREFIMQGGKDTRSLGRKIIDFFKSLFIKTKYWKDFRPSSLYYFRAINEGKYSERDISSTSINQVRTRQEEYTQEMKDILSNAKRDKAGNLLAPNGNPTNLTERQWVHVRTKAFKNWFGDWENNPEKASKVVDENGEPLVVYHNTPFEFDWVFDMDHPSRIAPWTSEPFGHVGSKETANRIKGTQYALFLNLRNPLKTPDFVHETANTMLSELYKQKLISRDEYASLRGISNSELRTLMQRLGYDGTMYENKAERGGISYSFIDPNQIKSATENVGTFSKTNNDIRYRKIPNSSFRSLSKEIQESLINKGWTAEKFNSVSQEERDNIIRCIAF